MCFFLALCINFHSTLLSKTTLFKSIKAPFNHAMTTKNHHVKSYTPCQTQKFSKIQTVYSYAIPPKSSFYQFNIRVLIIIYKSQHTFSILHWTLNRRQRYIIAQNTFCLHHSLFFFVQTHYSFKAPSTLHTYLKI